MTNNRLEWQQLLPDHTPYQTLFSQAALLAPAEFSAVQPRLADALTIFCHPRSPSRFMLLKAQENNAYLALIANAIAHLPARQSETLHGNRYQIDGRQISIQPAQYPDDNFAATLRCGYQEWIEPEQLFGCVRIDQDNISLQPGLLHRVNGGTLILSARTLLAQPLMWLRLKQIIIDGQYHWLSPDERRPLPVAIPPMPVDLRLIVLGDRESLGDIHEMEPELGELAIYGEFESQLQLIEPEDMVHWCSYINALCLENQLPLLAADAWPELFTLSVRYSGDQGNVPLCPQWLLHQLKHAALYARQEDITGQAIIDAVTARRWREGYLSERLQDEIELGQILIETEGDMIGQVNGLSVLEYPGYPLMFGEPTRISCVVHPGDGELTDVERKAELGGNLHAKGMMIMQAFLISELELEQQLPFSASIVFEQSYSEVDGDSASLAELSALVSALSLLPITQQLAVTGSVDQFGHVQPIGGVNEKIEGFFEVCQRRGLTGKQGVIIPATNQRHLCLLPEVIDAVREGQFHIYVVDSVAEALMLLTQMPYDDDRQPSLLTTIRERITQLAPPERRRFPWFFR
ncbi:Lon protease [Dickeya dianthicola]|uniref:endopeptidase La n=1 Tax=Dickeya dianthicola TaxID=204039 RepID=A0AAP2D3I6_9GAMM|nr:Lon protease family protein [Dickeya dianthicola]ATO33698.1 ATP-dependent protease La Type II [Dickeya dianthicola RNS04.9]AYC19569.1 Lon protease [Dickeya dianthicola]MBI0437507.1 Lon protease family protein [Dickeya dianthicola]MBI0447769.1 Lon protease family protein [Dickeya dianthicola]MBI0452386.1 Lon protease family protein [Dickeya dianthicola]